MSKSELKEKVLKEIEAQRAELIDLSLRIHAHPEPGLKEVKASEWLAEYLEGKGFEVERGICQMPTAFKATYGQGKPVIAFLAEDDALAELGHACGHNIIAASAVGAGVAARVAVDAAGGSIVVFGTPGEERYGCKELMVQRGAFDGVNAALMIHPGAKDVVMPPILACASLEVEFFGKAAHAAACPEEGINALEALILAYNNINSLRQHIVDGSRVHGIITNGGEASNIVPSYSRAFFLVRSDDVEYLEELKSRVLDCFTAASLASGARLEYRWGEVTYASLLHNPVLARLFTDNLEALGREVSPANPRHAFSTDMGNVSQVVPGLQPIISIAGPLVLQHSPEFAAAAVSEEGHRGLIDGAKALALTAVDLLTDREAMAEAGEEFRRAKSPGQLQS